MELDRRIKVLEVPGLEEPTLVAAWPGIGLVGYNAVEFLRTALDPRPVARIEVDEFFSLQGVQVKDGLCLPVHFPTNTFYGWKDPGGKRDILLFLGASQPISGMEMPLASLVVEFALKCGVRQVITAAAMVTQIDHMAPSKIWAVAGRTEDWGLLEKLGAQKLQEGVIGGLNGLLVGVAQQRGLNAACLMGEMPHYTTHIENPKASLVVLEMLTAMLGITVDLGPLRERSRFVETQIHTFLQSARERTESQETPAAAGPEGSEETELADEETRPEDESKEEETEPGRVKKCPPSRGGGPTIN
ncbi:MAG: PAC2 family protein [Candidatus Riflebacteria bacterium]|nr:PAC2 family protein [Candidatus Riflebacteria bacterium]